MRPAEPRVAALFDGHDALPAIIAGALEGYVGRVVPSNDAARIDVGVYRVFGGTAERALLNAFVPGTELIIRPDGDDWRAAARDEFGGRLHRRSMASFAATSLDHEHLERLAAGAPLATRRLDRDLATRLGDRLPPNRVETFDSVEAFLDRGFGFAALDGQTIACAATTYAISSRHAEIAIATHRDYRRRGLAVATAAHAILEALDRGLEPCWNAANDASCAVATKLGFTRSRDVTILELPSTEGTPRHL